MNQIILKVTLNCKNGNSCIMQALSKVEGIKSLAYDSGKSMLTVVGHVAPKVVVSVLRKMEHPAYVIAVGGAEKVGENSIRTQYCPACLSSYIAMNDEDSAPCTIM